jgi:hypothetical protein
MGCGQNTERSSPRAVRALEARGVRLVLAVKCAPALRAQCTPERHQQREMSFSQKSSRSIPPGLPAQRISRNLCHFLEPVEARPPASQLARQSTAQAGLLASLPENKTLPVRPRCFMGRAQEALTLVALGAAAPAWSPDSRGDRLKIRPTVHTSIAP